jgi:hypothetical protein
MFLMLRLRVLLKLKVMLTTGMTQSARSQG